MAPGRKSPQVACASSCHATRQKAHAAYEAATAHHQVALNDMDAAVAAAHEAMVASSEAMVASSEARYAAEAAEAVDAESEGEEVWEWDEFSVGEIREEVNSMIIAVSMQVAGFADCAGCAMLAFRRADHLAAYEDESLQDQYSSDHLGCREFLDLWDRSRPFEDTGIEGRHMASASGLRRPSDCAERCARCAGSADGWLTLAGKREVIRAFQAGERARTVVSEQREWLFFGLGADPRPAI